LALSTGNEDHAGEIKTSTQDMSCLQYTQARDDGVRGGYRGDDIPGHF
jgi:hypothetical protein